MELTINKWMKSKKGFTIVEVLVVIGIIAILTIIIFPAINNIRAKNRDAERVADLATLQIGLSLYYSQHTNIGYPATLLVLAPAYVPLDAVTSPTVDPYKYIPLKRSGSDKCTYYHLGTVLELQSGQINTADDFSSYNLDNISNGYIYYGNNPPANGIATGTKNYNVHP